MNLTPKDPKTNSRLHTKHDIENQKLDLIF